MDEFNWEWKLALLGSDSGGDVDHLGNRRWIRMASPLASFSGGVKNLFLIGLLEAVYDQNLFLIKKFKVYHMYVRTAN